MSDTTGGREQHRMMISSLGFHKNEGGGDARPIPRPHSTAPCVSPSDEDTRVVTRTEVTVCTALIVVLTAVSLGSALYATLV